MEDKNINNKDEENDESISMIEQSFITVNDNDNIYTKSELNQTISPINNEKDTNEQDIYFDSMDGDNQHSVEMEKLEDSFNSILLTSSLTSLPLSTSPTKTNLDIQEFEVNDHDHIDQNNQTADIDIIQLTLEDEGQHQPTTSFPSLPSSYSILEESTLQDLEFKDSISDALLFDQSQSLDDNYAKKVHSFIKARNLKNEFTDIERTQSRGRPQSNSRLFENTQSFAVKCNLRKAKEEFLQKKRSQSVSGKKTSTIPMSPKFHVANREDKPQLSTEDLTYQAVQEAKKIQERIMKKHQKMFQQLKSRESLQTTTTTARSTKELTIPMTPYSHVDHRLGKRESFIAPSEEKKEIKPKKLGPTHPQPFNLSTDVRASLRGDNHNNNNNNNNNNESSGLTAGELMMKFQRDPRSHNVPKNHTNTVTCPKSPKLRTSSRSDAALGRPKIPSRIEIEEAELQAAQSFVFKAKPVDKRILQSGGEIGVPKVQPKETTQPQEFHLASNQRAAYRLSNSNQQQSREDKPTFKARPMPSFEEDPRTKIRRGESKVTEAHSPKLHGNTRASSAPARRQRPNHLLAEKMKEEELQKVKAQTKQPLKITEPEEFELRTLKRGLAAKAALDSRLQRELEEEKIKSEIHARPFPEKIFKETFHLNSSTKPLTEFEEFHLATVERHLKSISKINEQQQQQQQQDGSSHENNENHTFHALPLPKSTFEPTFHVEPSHREPLMPKDVNLQSSIRAIQRKSFNETMLHQIEELEKQKENEENLKRKAEQKQLKILRSKSIEEGGYQFKAAPILQSDPYPTKYIEQSKLTEPVSPHLRTAQRVRITNKN